MRVAYGQQLPDHMVGRTLGLLGLLRGLDQEQVSIIESPLHAVKNASANNRLQTVDEAVSEV